MHLGLGKFLAVVLQYLVVPLEGVVQGGASSTGVVSRHVVVQRFVSAAELKGKDFFFFLTAGTSTVKLRYYCLVEPLYCAPLGQENVSFQRLISTQKYLRNCPD